MQVFHEADFPYRHGDHGPKYLLRGPRMNFGFVRLRPGDVVSPHYHQVMEENFYILEGEASFTVNGEPLAAHAGDLVHLEPGDTHRIENKADSVLQMVIALAPFQESDKISIEE